jgi:hypothetical protein
MFSRYVRRIGENEKKEAVSSSDVSAAGGEIRLGRREGLMERMMDRPAMAGSEQGATSRPARGFDKGRK